MLVLWQCWRSVVGKGSGANLDTYTTPTCSAAETLQYTTHNGTSQQYAIASSPWIFRIGQCPTSILTFLDSTEGNKCNYGGSLWNRFLRWKLVKQHTIAYFHEFSYVEALEPEVGDCRCLTFEQMFCQSRPTCLTMMLIVLNSFEILRKFWRWDSLLES